MSEEHLNGAEADEALYQVMSMGLRATEGRLPTLGIADWKLAMVAYDPKDPWRFLVVGTAGEEAFQEKVCKVVNPDWQPFEEWWEELRVVGAAHITVLEADKERWRPYYDEHLTPKAAVAKVMAGVAS